MADQPRIRRFPADHEQAYVVESGGGLVAVDGLLTVSGGREMRRAAEAIGKPLLAVLLTHAHPDRYGGLSDLVAGDPLPIIAPQGVIDAIVRDDPIKERILRPMFGDEWAATRTFPNTAIRDGESVTFGGLTFTVIDLGPSESPHDSRGSWRAARPPSSSATSSMTTATATWRTASSPSGSGTWKGCESACPPTPSFTSATGAPSGRATSAGSADTSKPSSRRSRPRTGPSRSRARARVVARMRAYLPVDDLRFLMELSIEPLASQLGLLDGRGGGAGTRLRGS